MFVPNDFLKTAAPARDASARALTSAFTAALLAVSLVALGACDSGGALSDSDQTTDDQTTTLSGTVTSENTSKASAATLSKTSTAAGPVENATVSAVRLNEDGSTTELDATTETDADGTFQLKVERQTDGATIVVKAEKSSSGFSSSVGVQVTDPTSTTAQPMTPETHAEAQVATEMETQAAGAEPASEALADAAALVDNDVASAILSGDTAPSEIAGLARSMDEAADDYAGDAETSVDESAVAEAETKAYEKLQAALATASDSADRAQALSAFEDAMAASHEAGGASEQLQAEITQTGTQVALSAANADALPSAAERGLERRATVLRAIATGGSVEQTAANKGTGGDVGGPLASARETLVSEVRSAGSVSEIQSAVSDYRSSVKSELETGFNMGATDVQDGFDNLQSALDALNGALDTAITTTDGLEVNADAVSSAFQSFYSNGEQAVKDVYSNRGMQAGPAGAAADITAKVGVL